MRYLLQTVNGLWEEVDEYVFTRRSNVFDKDESPRYNDVYVTLDSGNSVTIHGTVSLQGLGVICRILGVTIPTSSVPGGYLREPESVMIRTTKKNYLLHQMNGDNFIRYRAKSKAA